jgi:hypothetical protein
MKAKDSSETSVNVYKTTRRNNSEVSNLHNDKFDWNFVGLIPE